MPDEDDELSEVEKAREAARQAAFALADQDLSEDEDPARAPGPLKGQKRGVPVSLLIAAFVLCGVAAVIVVQLMPKPHKLVAGAQVAVLPENRLQVSANVSGADVFIGSSFVGKTPLDVENTYPFGQRVEMVVRALGFPDVPAMFVGGRGQKIRITFAPKPDDE